MNICFQRLLMGGRAEPVFEGFDCEWSELHAWRSTSRGQRLRSLGGTWDTRLTSLILLTQSGWCRGLAVRIVAVDEPIPIVVDTV
jgi:hypothetical protein